MEVSVIMEKLLDVDRELHSLIGELKSEKQSKLSLDELNKLMEKDRIDDIDSTELIRSMREKEY